MLITKTVFSVVTESDYDFRAIRLIRGNNQYQFGSQVLALLWSFRRDKRGMKWAFRFIWGSNQKFAIGWRSDSAQWSKTFRGIKYGFFGLEISRYRSIYVSR